MYRKAADDSCTLYIWFNLLVDVGADAGLDQAAWIACITVDAKGEEIGVDTSRWRTLNTASTTVGFGSESDRPKAVATFRMSSP